MWGIAGLVLLFSLLDHFFSSKTNAFFILTTLLVFFLATFITAVRRVLFEGRVDANKIVGSITLFMLLGLIWTVIYLQIALIDPEAFSGLDVTNWKEGFSRMAYYSYVTLTTLGYGDILPKNHIAEFFVYLESIAGVFYMAIIVSSLISLRLNAIEKEKSGQ